MRNKWYGDKRDLVKWSILLSFANNYSMTMILQIAYFRKDEYEGVNIDGEAYEIPHEILSHFRDIRKIESLSNGVKIRVFDKIFENRNEYLYEAIEFIRSFEGEKCIVFLDPDTGLEPTTPSLNHVLVSEIKQIWDALKSKDVLVLYQHQTNRNGEPWIEPKRLQFEKAICVSERAVKCAHGLKVANDVAFLYSSKE